MIDLASLTALRAVDDHGSVVAAAEALGFTPSAISQQVKRLERQTNVPLLERVGRGVMLTREGRHLVDAGSRLLADLETIESGLHQQAGTVAGHLRIIAFSTAMRGLVAPRVRALLDAHPDLVLSLTEREPWDTVDLVATGQADVGVVHSWGDVPLAWLEDPMPPENVTACARLARLLPAPVGYGDEITDEHLLARLVEAEAMRVVRVDATTIGGITGAVRAVGMAVRAGATIAAGRLCRSHVPM